MSEGRVDAKMAGPALHEPPLERPIQNEKQDRFGRTGFVSRIANSLIGHDGKKARGEPPRVCRRLFCLSYAAMAGCSSEA